MSKKSWSSWESWSKMVLISDLHTVTYCLDQCVEWKKVSGYCCTIICFCTIFFFLLLVPGNFPLVRRPQSHTTSDIHFIFSQFLFHLSETQEENRGGFSPNQACWSPCTSMAKPKSASFTDAPFILLARRRFSGCSTKTINSLQLRGKKNTPTSSKK